MLCIEVLVAETRQARCRTNDCIDLLLSVQQLSNVFLFQVLVLEAFFRNLLVDALLEFRLCQVIIAPD